MKFQVFSGFISFLILEIVIECPEEIFKKLLNVTIYLYDNYLGCFSYIIPYIYDKLVTMLLFYHFLVAKLLFQLLSVQTFQYN